MSFLAPVLLNLAAQQFKPYAHPVMIWVPPYAVGQSESQLHSPFVDQAITHLSLQFWVPTKDGHLAFDASTEVSDATVARLRDWGHIHNVRVMLTVYNGEHTWDWPLAKAAFADHEDTFVNTLVTEMTEQGLDGIDIDLEGPAHYQADKPSYLDFVKKLSTRVHALQKQLTLDSFCYVWNAPNQGWWPDLFPLVDAITTMGYAEIGRSAPDWHSYSSQIAAAGSNAAKLLLGVPAGRDAWEGNTSAEQLGWIKENGRSGIGIWDARLRGSSWKLPDLWKVINQVRKGAHQ